MKKIILILLVCLFSLACNKYVVENVFQKIYPVTQVQLAYHDVYSQLYKYGLDSIPLDKWITNDMTIDTIHISQKIVRKVVNKTNEYTFIFTSYVYPKTSFYEFVVRYDGKKK